MQQTIVSNINKIDYSLKTVFDKVKITEKSSKELGKYFLIELNESKIREEFKPYTIKIQIPYKNLLNENLTWSYFANPLTEEEPIQRSGDLISNTIDILQKKKFDKEYLESVVVDAKPIYSVETISSGDEMSKEYILEISKSAIEALFNKENIQVENLDIETDLIDETDLTNINKNYPTIKKIKYVLTAKISPYDGMIIEPSSIDKIRKELSKLPVLGDNFSISINVELDSTDLSIIVKSEYSLSNVKIIQ